MSLPNPTKTNYANVDDITPAEMNDIGTNLISLGQKIQKVVDDTWITTNANYNGTAWDRIDIAKAATALQIGIDGSKTAWHVVAGANPIVWVQGEKWDASGKLVSGVVPLARMIEHTYATGTGSQTDVTTASPLSIGDLVLVSATLQEDATDGLLGLNVTQIGTATGIWEPEATTIPQVYSATKINDQVLNVTGIFRCTIAGTGIFRTGSAGGGGSPIVVFKNAIGVMHYKA